MKVIFLLGLLIFAACGADDDDLESGQQQEDSLEKNLFSLWSNREDESTVDLTNMNFGTPMSTEFILSSGEICSCSVLLTGDQSTGTMEVFNCFNDDGGLGEPDCDALWENGRRPYGYTNSDRIMVLCEAPGVCETYH